MDWKSIVSAIAPVLGTALGGPLGGMAMSAVAKAVTGNESAPEKDVIKAVTSLSPDALVALKAAENTFAIRMKELDIDLERINTADTADARKSMSDNKSFTPLFSLSVIIIATTFGLEGFAMVHGLPDGVDDLIVGRVLGTLDGATVLVLGFWYGSSHGSQKKDAHTGR